MAVIIIAPKIEICESTFAKALCVRRETGTKIDKTIPIYKKYDFNKIKIWYHLAFP